MSGKQVWLVWHGRFSEDMFQDCYKVSWDERAGFEAVCLCCGEITKITREEFVELFRTKRIGELKRAILDYRNTKEKLTLPEAAKAILGDAEWNVCRCAFKGLSPCGHLSCAEGRILYALREAAKMNIDWEAK